MRILENVATRNESKRTNIQHGQDETGPKTALKGSNINRFISNCFKSNVDHIFVDRAVCAFTTI